MHYETTKNNDLHFTAYMFKRAGLDIETWCWEFIFGSLASLRDSGIIYIKRDR